MQPHTIRFGLVLVLIHWVVVSLIAVLLGLGYYLRSPLPAAAARAFLVDMHTSLGLSVGILLLVQMLMRLIARPRLLPDTVRWRRLASRLYRPIYGLALLLVVSGYLHVVFSGNAPVFWQVPIPLWGVPDPGLADFFLSAHDVTAMALAGLLLIHVVFAIMNRVKHAEIVALERRAAAEKAASSGRMALTIPADGQLVLGLAGSLRLYGWIAFWLQLTLAFVCGLLLVVATSGRVVSPGAIGLGDAMSWASVGFVLLLFAVALSFHYPRLAQKLSAAPAAYFNHQRTAAFWFLSAGALGGLAGIGASFIGLALSISLLVAKTISQPPGIAITDPSKIIRALDVFVLIVNFSLLMAHFIGTATALWLKLRVAKARRDYLGADTAGTASDPAIKEEAWP